MINFERRYTEDMGLLSVVVLSSDSGMVKEKLTVIEEIICFKSGKPHLMTIKWTKGFIRRFNYRIQKNEEITEDEYQKLLMGSR